VGFFCPNEEDMLQAKEATNFVLNQSWTDTTRFRKSSSVPPAMQVSLLAHVLSKPLCPAASPKPSGTQKGNQRHNAENGKLQPPKIINHSKC